MRRAPPPAAARHARSRRAAPRTLRRRAAAGASSRRACAPASGRFLRCHRRTVVYRPGSAPHGIGGARGTGSAPKGPFGPRWGRAVPRRRRLGPRRDEGGDARANLPPGPAVAHRRPAGPAAPNLFQGRDHVPDHGREGAERDEAEAINRRCGEGPPPTASSARSWTSPEDAAPGSSPGPSHPESTFPAGRWRTSICKCVTMAKALGMIRRPIPVPADHRDALAIGHDLRSVDVAHEGGDPDPLLGRVRDWPTVERAAIKADFLEGPQHRRWAPAARAIPVVGPVRELSRRHPSGDPHAAVAARGGRVRA